MPSKPASAARPSPEADLAFLRSIVESGGKPSMTMAVCYLAGGLLYGLQCLFHIGQIIGLIRWPDLANLAFVVGITVTLLGVIVWASMRDKREAGIGGGNRGPLATRTLNAGFSSAGMVNLAMVIIFGVGAARDNDFALWLYYPAVVFGLQAAVWSVAWVLKKKAWMLATSAGGWLTTVALGLLVREPVLYLYVCTAALFLLFALPGWIMLRETQAGRAA